MANKLEMLDKCLVAGSFDPITNGHMYLIGMANMTFKSVVVGIGINSSKKYDYPLDSRLQMVKKACQKYQNVQVVAYSGLTADFMRENNIKYLVRGVRDKVDSDYEQKVFKEISNVNPNVELVLFNSPKDLKNISSTHVKELIKQNKQIANFVPYEIIPDLTQSSTK